MATHSCTVLQCVTVRTTHTPGLPGADFRNFAKVYDFSDFLRFKFWFSKVKLSAEFDENIYNFVRFLVFGKN